MVLKTSRRRRRTVIAVLLLLWAILGALGHAPGARARIDAMAHRAIEGARAIDPFLVLRVFFGRLIGDREPAIGLEPAVGDEPRDPPPPRVNGFLGLFVAIFDALRFTAAKVAGAGWPAVIPGLLSLGIGAAVVSDMLGGKSGDEEMFHPMGLFLMLLMVLGIAGVIALICRLILLAIFTALGAASALAFQAALVIYPITEVIGRIRELGERVEAVARAVEEPPDPPAAVDAGTGPDGHGPRA